MTTLIKTFACAAAASLLLLSCNDTAPTASSEEDNNPTVAKGQPPNDPAVVIIEDNVQKWMNENLASKIGEKRLVQVSDMHLDDSEAPGLSASYNSAGEAEYYQNGQKISSQEYMRIWQEYDMKKQRGKRNLSIPGEIISDDSRSWTVLITAEELAGLTKKYGELAI
ncbi:MAG: hypothetical protein FWF63_10080, partial [Fibromonadales bacterium]|nr:hypothetical protein [Fibromonadales bacterium]